jgi:hypothetical protein
MSTSHDCLHPTSASPFGYLAAVGGVVHPRSRAARKRFVIVGPQPRSGRYSASLGLRDRRDDSAIIGSRPSAFAQYVSAQLERIAERSRDSSDLRGPVRGSVLIRLSRALDAICGSDTVFPNISVDGEGGVSATWMAGDFVLEIVCLSDLGLELTRHRGADSVQFVIEPDFGDSISRARSEVDQMSQFVRSANPRWRDTVRSTL